MKERLTGRSLLHLLLELVIVCAGVFGSLFCLCTSFEIPFPSVLWAAVPALALVICFLRRVRKGGLVCLGLGLVFLAVCFLLRRPLLRYGRALWNVLAYRYDKGYVLMSGMYNAALGVDAAAAARFLIPLGLLETFFAALSVSHWKSTAVCMLSLLPGIVPCFVLIDTPPKLWALFLVVACLLFQLFSQNVRRREPRETGLAVLWAGLITAVALTALVLIFPPNRYRTPMTWEKLNEQLEKLTAKWENRNNERAGLSGNPNTIRLKDLRSLPDSSLDVMRIETDYRGRLYLRGTAYEGFDGRNWTRLSGRDWEDPAIVYPSLRFPRFKPDIDIDWVDSASSVLVVPADGSDSDAPSRPDSTFSSLTYYAQGGAYSLTVHPISRADNSVVYVPYDPISLPDSAVLVSDSHLKNRRPSSNYSLDFTVYPEMLSEVSPEYTQYVLETCLSLPEDQKAALRDWLAENGGGDLLNRRPEPATAAQRIVELVSQGKEYSRKSSTAPSGKDFVLWFLDEAESGYCVHFATTATALLRAVGVPARYVTGYVCKVSGAKTTVTSLNAHAWVEYFVDGAWRKLDPTPGEGERDDPAPTTEPTTEAPPTETIIPTDETLPVPTHTRPVAPTGETVVRPTPTEAESTGESPVRPLPGPPAETPTGKAVSGTLWIVLGVIGLLFLIWLRRYLARLLRQRRLERTNGNQKAIWMYRRITRLNRRIHVKNSEEVEAMGKKAAFSQHELDNDELNVLYRGMLVAEVRMGRTRPWKRLYYKYILAII